MLLAVPSSGSEIFGFFFFSSRRRHTRFDCDWSSDVCSSDLRLLKAHLPIEHEKKFVAPAHNSERRIGYLGGQFAIIKPFALTIHHRPSFKGSFAGVDPFDSVAARIVEQQDRKSVV